MSSPAGPKLPVAGKRNILITSALPYVNNVPHLGNIVGCVLSGDVYARFCRQRGYNALYVCGTDEYGTATETKAQQEGLTPQQICDKYHVIHKAVYDWFDIKFDHFGRTTTPLQTEIAQDIFKKCDANGNVLTDSVQQLFCAPCDRFLADRYVAGTCPLCKYPDAKGDQCDGCSQLMNAVDLISPKCTTCGASPEVRTSSHLFLDLPKIEPRLVEFVKRNSKDWSANAKQVTDAWVNMGLRQRAITRDLKWGTPVPKPGFESKVFYVWFDAPIGYISITANYTSEWERWWKPAAEDKVELTQFLGKDNIPFHTVIFPSTLLAADDKYILLNDISSTEYLNYEGEKFSKSRGVGVFGDQARDTGIPVEVWRYYLLANRPEQSDTMFTWDDFAAKANTELPNNLGNLVQRVLAFIKTRFDGVVPAVAADKLGEREAQLEEEVSGLLVAYVAALDGRSIREALRLAMSISLAGNKYMQEKQPWAQAKDDVAAAGTSLAVLTQLIYLLTVVFEPFMPSFSAKVLAQLALELPTEALAGIDTAAVAATGADADPETTAAVVAAPSDAWPLRRILAAAAEGASACAGLLAVPSGHALGDPAPIFAKIDAGRIIELRQKFKGAAEAAAEGTPFPAALITGTVTEVGAHPTNAKLYVLKVDCGEAQQRQIVSKLVDSYAPEELQGKAVVVLANLKYGKFGGVLSEGMLLTGVYADGDKSVVKVLSSDAPKGTKVVPEGFVSAPAKVFDVKSKLTSLKLSVGTDNKAQAGTAALMAGKAFVTAEGAPEGSTVC